MSTIEEQIEQIETAISAQETLRPTLGDAVVETTIAALRARLDGIRAASSEAAPPVQATPSADEVALLHAYLPMELATKMRRTGRIESERRRVTVLFADLVGSTALGEGRDPEEVAALMQAAMRELAEAAYEFEGYVDKFVGDGIMVVFGAPITHEDDAERALRCALAMRERIEQLDRHWVHRIGHRLILHVGVNSGTVIAGSVGSDLRLSYTVLGDTVNIAARLEHAAGPGQILVSHDTYQLTREAFTFRPLTPIRVKGKREPLTVFELGQARLLPDKSRGHGNLAPAFVGREREIEQLRAVMDRLAEGRGQIVTISGEAGIGKSRLLREWRRQIDDRVNWLEGRSFAHTTALAYGPFLDLLRRHAGIQDEDSEARTRARLDAAIQQLYPGNLEAMAVFASLLAMQPTPEEAQILDRLPAEALRQRLFALVEDLFARMAARRPVWFVVEDMHWADPSSIDLVKHLLPLADHLPFVIVGVFRAERDEPSSRIRAAIAAHHASGVVEISLAPLPADRSLEMVELLLATDELPEALRTLIVNKSDGNPFFVEEVLQALIERGALVRGDGRSGWTVTPLIESVSIPDTLQGLLMSRLDRLPDDIRWVAQQAAVIGRIFLQRILLQMAERSSEIEADLSYLQREELIRRRARDPEVEYIFNHALTQEVAYQSLLTTRRCELHRRVGEAIEAIFAERIGEFYGILGEHFLRGEAWEKALADLCRAGDASIRVHAHAEARIHFTKALAAISHLEDTVEVRRQRVDVVVKLVSVSFGAESPERNLALLAEAEALAAELPGADGEPGGDRLRLAQIHNWMGRSHMYGNNMREAIGYYQRVLTEAQGIGNEELVAIPSSVIGRVLMAQGQFARAGELVTRSIGPLEKIGSWQESIISHGYSGISLAARGFFKDGLAAGETALARAHGTNNLTVVSVAHILLAVIRLFGGDMAKLAIASAATVQAGKRSGDPMYVYAGYGLWGWAQSRLVKHAEATEMMARSREVGQSLGGRLILADWFAAAEAELALNAGLVEEAVARAETVAAMAAAAGGIFAEGMAQRVWGSALARLGRPRWDDVDEHFSTSLRALTAGDGLLEAARTQVAWGRVCQARGDRSAAREHFEAAASQFAASEMSDELECVRRAIGEVDAYSA